MGRLAAPASLAEISDALARGELGFRAAVYAAVRRIPAGTVLGYGMVAAVIGRPRAARQVGYALAALDASGCAPDGEPVPWWRVPRSDGSIAMQGSIDRGSRQMALLEAEGVVCANQRVDMRTHRWNAPLDG